ncbi:hypothetical protein [Aquimarina sp. MMG016]|uniref:hypothetical protein n=1 Tax=Aquimarina sp. MMG016 TaxID=2822690 RepID=UPI001B39E88D|nr:hypothetical protein [Aquimarina sp. MMG016]MBQ4819284.1 hypothetical protein [Aquimarina sp. MMG016]
METFDIERFNKNKDEEGNYIYTTNDGYTVEESGGLNDGGFIKIKYKAADDFRDFFRFFSSGKLKIQGRFYHNEFDCNTWSYYDEQGELDKKVDYDQPFVFHWDKIKAYLTQHECDLEKDIIRVSRYTDENTPPFWELEFNGKYKKIKGRFVIKLDGVTGEEIIVKQFLGKKTVGKSGTTADYKILLNKEG